MKKIIVLILFVQILINVYSQDSINRNLNIVNPQNIVPEYHCEPFVISVKMKVLEDEELVKGVVISRVIPKCKRDSMRSCSILRFLIYLENNIYKISRLGKIYYR